MTRQHQPYRCERRFDVISLDLQSKTGTLRRLSLAHAAESPITMLQSPIGLRGGADTPVALMPDLTDSYVRMKADLAGR